MIWFGDDTTSCNSHLTTSTTPIVVGFGQSITFDESVATYRERYLYTNATMYERDYFMTNKYRVMNLLKCGFKSLHGFKATHILHAAYPAVSRSPSAHMREGYCCVCVCVCVCVCSSSSCFSVRLYPQPKILTCFSSVFLGF